MRIFYCTHYFIMVFLLPQLLPTSAQCVRETLMLGEMEEEKPSVKKQSLSALQKKTLKLGTLDPRLPVGVKYHPNKIKLPKIYRLPEDFHAVAGKLDLRSLTPITLMTLTNVELKDLLLYLGKIPLTLKWWDKKGHVRSGKRHGRPHIFHRWDRTNAAAALTLFVGIHGGTDLFARMIALAPDAVLPEFKGHASGLLTQELSAKVLIAMMDEIDCSNSSTIAKSAATLTEYYVKYWAEKDSERLTKSLLDLIKETKEGVEKIDKPFKEKRGGILLGSLLAGTMRYANAIKEADMKKLMIVNALSNIIWAATSFIGIAPLAGPVIAGVGGGISMAVVLGAVLANEFAVPRDFLPKICEIEGHIEMATLEAALTEDKSCKLNALSLLSWMRSAIHVNGLSD